MADQPDQGVKGRGTVICLAAGHSSERYCADHDEMIAVIEGEGIIEGGGAVRQLKKGESIFIEKGSEYRMRNTGKTEFIFVRIGKEYEKEAG